MWAEVEFEWFKRTYRIPDVRLKIGDIPYFDGTANFSFSKNLIEIRTGDATPTTALALSHEFCHAIQHKEGRLEAYHDGFEQLWRLERELLCSPDLCFGGDTSGLAH